ncbi:hypothetical protein H632_c1933p1 [Helicosporidium sp. ATCC 50920]|nr:hypothetical protein H632_c1933p1 [Helicosporidium sp. ATCC 50920]|eukprot:KDD73680.1 hypothetical protein H632_c1933p1 [Helicosporidium sp. ATCC 50920]
MEFVSRTFGALLTCEQKAVAIVQSYPFFPDTYAIATVAIARAGGSLEVSGIEREALARLDAKVFPGVRWAPVAEAGSAVDAS